MQFDVDLAALFVDAGLDASEDCSSEAKVVGVLGAVNGNS